VLGRRAWPALSRLRHAVQGLRGLEEDGGSRERARLLNEVARQERALTHVLELYLAARAPASPASRALRLRARS
jgi:hypothetical protein